MPSQSCSALTLRWPGGTEVLSGLDLALGPGRVGLVGRNATLDRLGLPSVDLDRTVGTLSGGEAILLGFAARFLARPDVLLLDEPTNNLDLRHPPTAVRRDRRVPRSAPRGEP